MTELRFYSCAPRNKALAHPRKKHPMAASSPQSIIGNDPLDPSRLSLNNGIQQDDFFIGPLIPSVNATPVRNTFEYLAKRDGADEFVTLKILTVTQEGETNEDRQGKVLLHNEHLILSLLQDQRGVIHHRGLFKDRNRYILALDCLVAHEYDPERKYSDYVNLQHYVIKKKRLQEREALEVFSNVLTTVQSLHKVCASAVRVCVCVWWMCVNVCVCTSKQTFQVVYMYMCTTLHMENCTCNSTQHSLLKTTQDMKHLSFGTSDWHPILLCFPIAVKCCTNLSAMYVCVVSGSISDFMPHNCHRV